MKKILLLSAAACSILFYACKKDSKTDTTTPVTEIPAIDPVALASNIKVGYSATSDTGVIPATSTDAGAPVLDTRYDNITYSAVNNRYVVIYPQSLSGAVKGYYLKINGANARFKIDYTTAYNLRKAKEHSFLREGDNSDSSIVIKLPAGLKGDTFSVKYAAYDSLNRVSNTINAIVSIVASADSTDDNALLGTWKVSKFMIGDQSMPYGHPDSTDIVYYSCTDNVLTPDENGDIKIPNSIYTYDIIFQFTSNNLMNGTQSYTSSHLVEDSSACSHLVYNTAVEQDNVEISYSYNASTKTLTTINDYKGTGSNITTQQFTVTTLTSTKLTMYAAAFNSGYHDQLILAYYEFQKSAN